LKTKITILALLAYASITFTYSQNGASLINEAGSLSFFKPGSFSKPETKTSQTGEAKTSLSASENYYIEGFEGGTFPPEGWQTRNITGAEVWGIPNIDISSGNHSAVLTHSPYTELDWLITPQHTVVLGDSLTFQFAWYCSKVITADTFRILVSAINDVPTDSLALEAAFSDTLFVFYTVGGYGWNRYSVSLDKYAGKQIYIAFKEHYINGHGVGIDDVTLGHRDYDITALNANMDEWAFVGDTAKPAARFQNAGYAGATFDAVAEIEALGYSSRKTFKNVAHDSIVEVVFDGLVPAVAGAFDIRIYADMTADENISDNELSAKLNVTERFTPAAWHMETPIPAGYAVHGSFPYTKKSSDPAKPDTTFLYVMGGYRAPNTSQDSIYKYNTLSKEWTYLGKSGLLASDIIALQVKGKAYMAGGYIGSDISSSLLIYDIEADSFMTGKSMPNPVRSYAAASYGDSLIYIFGGLKDNSSYQFTSDVLVYNINTDEWAPATLLPDDYLMGVSAVIAGNKIVLTGSYETYTAISNKAYFGEIDPADPYTINWSTERRPCQGIIFAAAGAWYGKEKSYAFFVGGQTTESQYNKVLWVYDLNDKKWLKGPDQLALSLYAPTISPIVRNDSVYMALTGGLNLSDSYNTNQWLYIGKDKPLNYSSRDLAAVSINADDTVYANNEITVKASFTNKQLAVQTFDAVMEITPGSYKKSATVTALEHLGVKEISFPAWKPDTAGTYAIKVYAAVNGDEDAGNDTLTSTVVVRNTIGVGGEDMAPAVYSLSQNYPNPFNPSTVIKYSVAQTGIVELKVYNMLGQEVKTLVNEMKSAGRYEVKFNAADLSSGVYVYRIKSGNFVQTKKLMLIK
jgi:hypothetical protein